MLFDSVQIGVADVAASARLYRILLGRDGEPRAGPHRFALERGAVELVPGDPGLRSLRFALESGDAPLPADAKADGIALLTAATRELPPTATPHDRPHAIDHVVVQSPNLERAIATWRDRFGLRLALDREFPQRGLRLVFFRSAGVTLELSGSLTPTAAAGGDDSLWGVAYQVADIAACRTRLLAAGVVVSGIRPGQKKGTLVATAKSHTLEAPTLIIQPVA